MPKMKTKRAAAKRFKITKSGKAVRMKTNKKHILYDKDSKRKRKLGKKTLVDPTDRKRVERMINA